ncbi:uncharacterized protein LOC129776063 [Toxorhynchites rutilus septentrionalis]|uniref:uncharacterized protein LOC129776063 n=1 Tax=Toxorhynchites rutilus septentrionalis TaxID=329112 RepID=UPI002479A508|nr:uncharacterized protein LOC129776063 [Toxorhynchites rutilus septentrionalis]
MADSEEQKLTIMFKTDASSIISLMFLHPVPVREKVKEWMATLYKMGSNILDQQMRNRYAAYLLMQLEVNQGLSKPFEQPAPDHIHIPLAKIVGVDEYIQLLEKCERYYVMKKRPNNEESKERRTPYELMYRMPPADHGVIVYGACFSKDDQ